ncbi:MAG TPA: UbiD family decarboxylase [Nitrososphaeraceae archaeon]|jgi:UbiD family decarboxylase|nr:UbiD family decarboxylase [Nitrososphaeraceae archaeon]
MKTAIEESNEKRLYKNSNDFRGFLGILEREKDLIRINKTVNTKFEIAALVSKLEKKQAVLFENVEGSKISVACNVLGTRKRFSLAVGVDDENAIHTHIIQSIAKATTPRRFSGDAPFYQNSSNDLKDLPVITHFEKDAGAFITSSIVFAKNQEKDNQNSSTHRLLLLDKNHMAIRMVEGRHLHKCYSFAKDHGEDLKVAIAIGVHPAVSIAAAYQAAYGIDEMLIANSLLHNDLKLSKSNFSQLYVPTHSEIVLEGKILKDRTEEEWMVEMLRTYDFKRKQPVFELDKIRFRSDAIFYDILPGFAEHRLLMGLPVESKMFEVIKNVVPSTKTVHLTDGGSNWLDAVIQIQKRLEGEPKNALLAAFTAHPSLKIAIVVDDDIDPTNPVSVEYAISTRCQADKGFLIVSNAKGSSLDPSSDQQNLLTAKVGIDATATLIKPKERFEIAKIPGEEYIKLSDYVSHPAT